MKKTLVAVAAFAAVTSAMADVSITGLVESAYTKTAKTANLGGGQNGGSEVRFGASEDLGNGLKASFQYTVISNMNVENGPNAVDAAATSGYNARGNVTSYNSFIGLSGDFGSVKLGNQFSPYFLAASTGSVTGWSALDASGASYTPIVRLNSSMTYTSPSFSGFSLSVQGDPAATSNSYSLNYANGGLSAAFASNKDASSKVSTAYAVAYDFGVAKLAVNSQTLNSSTITSKQATEVGIAVPMGAATLVASTTSSTISGDKISSMVGIKYDLSKRTQLYAFNTVTGSATAATNTGLTGFTAGSVKNIVGVQHAF